MKAMVDGAAIVRSGSARLGTAAIWTWPMSGRWRASFVRMSPSATPT
jgi:hypothetical protein